MDSGAIRDVMVIGAGISGLTTAWRLHRAGVDVGLLEADATVGGVMRSERRDGLILEKGPFNVLVRDDSFHEMLDACQGDVTPVIAAEEAQKRFIYKGGVIHEVPTGPGPLIGSKLLSMPAKVRALTSMLISPRAKEAEPTIDQAARRRLGGEVADIFISSIVAGVFGGDSRNLSLKACFPNAYSFDQNRRSPLLYEMEVLKAKKRKLEQHPERKKRKGLVSFEGGLQSLADWLAGELGDRLETGTRVERIEREGDGYRIFAQRDGESVEYGAKRIVLATPSEPTAKLLEPHVPDASRLLRGIEHASLVVLNLAFRSEDVGHPMQGYGFLVPRTETSMPVMGVLWADSAFPHHAHQGTRLIRVFLGGAKDPEATERSQEELLATAMDALRAKLDLKGDPTHIDLCRWPKGIPQYTLGHTERIAKVRKLLTALPGVHLVGSYLTGISVNDCVRDGTAMAKAIVMEMGAGQAESPAAASMTSTE